MIQIDPTTIISSKCNDQFYPITNPPRKLGLVFFCAQKNPDALPHRGYTAFSREPGRTRTCDRLLRRQMLYPAELRVQTHRVRRRSCREDRTRTCDPLVPNQMRYHLRHFPNMLMNFSSRKDWDSNPGDASATTA